MHTPGPWQWTTRNRVRDGYADESPWQTLTDGHGVPITKATQRPVREEMANAYLIAAAPELLGALREFVDVDDADRDGRALISNQGQGMDGYTKLANYERAVSRARAVIAKAEGK